MRQLFVVTILLLLLMQAMAGSARAAARLGLFLLDAPVQKVDLSYQFDGSQQARSWERHAAVEDYTFKVNYSVVRPSILKGSFLTTLRFDQKLTSTNGGDNSSASNIAFLYNINGEMFSQSNAPAAFSVSSDIFQVSTPFARTYQLTNNNYDFRWALKNSMLPMTIEYRTGTSTSSGLKIDSTRESEEVNLRVGHREKNNSTSLELEMLKSIYTPEQGEGNFDNRFQVKLMNNLAWDDDGKIRSFDSRLNYSETAGINSAKYLNLDQGAIWDLGKSLKSGGNYSLATVSGDPGSQAHNSGNLWIQHQLFKSLTTRLSFRARKDSYSAGDDREVGGDVSLAYVKQLPKESSISLGASEGYSINDRNLGSDRQKIFNEQHLVTFGVSIPLGKPNVVSSSIIIRNADPQKRLLPYDSVIDFQIVANGALIEIVPVASGAIVDGDTLLISYDYLVDPHFKSISDTFSTNASLALFGGTYRMYGLHSRSRQDLVAGQANLSSLTVQQMSRLGFDRKWQLITLNTEYESYDSTADRHQSVQAMASYADLVKSGNMGLLLSERYQWYGLVTQGNRAVQRGAENFFTVAANYSAGISATTQWSLVSKYINVSGASTSDSLMIGSTLRWTLGRLSAMLETSLGLRRFGGVSDYTESVRFGVTRYFY